MPATKNIETAEIRYQSGEVQFRYGRYLAADGQRWIRHGPFREFYANGQVASEGEYADGLEQGLWRDYHENGQVAAEGHFVDGPRTASGSSGPPRARPRRPSYIGMGSRWNRDVPVLAACGLAVWHC